MNEFEPNCNPQSFDQCTAILSGLPITFYSLDPLQGSRFYSTHVEELIGYRPDELTTHRKLWYESIHPDDRPAVDTAITDALGGLRALDLDYRVRHKEGYWVWVHDQGNRMNVI